MSRYGAVCRSLLTVPAGSTARALRGLPSAGCSKGRDDWYTPTYDIGVGEGGDRRGVHAHAGGRGLRPEIDDRGTCLLHAVGVRCQCGRVVLDVSSAVARGLCDGEKVTLSSTDGKMSKRAVVLR